MFLNWLYNDIKHYPHIISLKKNYCTNIAAKEVLETPRKYTLGAPYFLSLYNYCKRLH